jgi:hypothetical protein
MDVIPLDRFPRKDVIAKNSIPAPLVRMRRSSSLLSICSLEKSHRRAAGERISIELVMRLVLFASSQDEQPLARAMSMMLHSRPLFGRK